MADFDVKRVTTLEWAGIGAGILAFIVGFFPWASVDFGDDLGFGLDVSGNAWQVGFLAWFSVLLLLAAAVVIALPHFGTPIPNRNLIWLGLSGLATLFTLLQWPTLGEYLSASVGLFLGIVVALVSAVAAFLNYRAAPKPNTTPQPGTAYGA